MKIMQPSGKPIRQSAFKITNAVAEHYDSWDGQKIEARQKKQAAIAAGIWKIDFSD